MEEDYTGVDKRYFERDRESTREVVGDIDRTTSFYSELMNGSTVSFGVRRVNEGFELVPLQVKLVANLDGGLSEIAYVSGILKQNLDSGISPFNFQYKGGISPLTYELLRTPSTREMIDLFTERWEHFYLSIIQAEISEDEFSARLGDFTERSEKLFVESEISWLAELIIGLSKHRAIERISARNLQESQDHTDYLLRESQFLRLWFLEVQFAYYNRDVTINGVDYLRSLMWTLKLFDPKFSKEAFLPFPHFNQFRGLGPEELVGLDTHFPKTGLEDRRYLWGQIYEKALEDWICRQGILKESIIVLLGSPGGGKTTLGLALLRAADLSGIENRFGEVRFGKAEDTIALKGTLGGAIPSLESRGYSIHPRITALAGQMARGSVEVFLDGLEDKQDVFGVVESWFENPLFRNIVFELLDDIDVFIKEFFGEEFRDSFIRALYTEQQVYIPIELRWYIERLFALYEREMQDLLQFPIGTMVYLDTPASLCEYSLRRQAFFSDPRILPFIRLVGKVMKDTYGWVSVPSTRNQLGTRDRLHPSALGWLVHRNVQMSAISRHIHGFNDEEVLLITLESLSLQNTLIGHLLAEDANLSVKELGEYREFIELQELTGRLK